MTPISLIRASEEGENEIRQEVTGDFKALQEVQLDYDHKFCQELVDDYQKKYLTKCYF